MRKNIMLSYSLALFVILIWSVTFVFTKVLLKYISPTEIILYRFVIAYLLFFAASPRIIWPLSFRDEVKFALAGLLGVTFYYICENFALSFTTVTNVSLLVATSPMLTGLVSHFFTKEERITKRFIYGGMLCLIGVFLIIFNGHFSMQLNPTGDILALVAALSFAFYSVIVRDIGSTIYSAATITRKTFFYSLLWLFPLLFTPLIHWDPQVLMNREALGCLLFLAIFPSAIRFLLWNKVIWDLGAVKANNLIYLSPPMAMLFAAVVLHERITVFAAVGGLFVLLGVYLSQKK